MSDYILLYDGECAFCRDWVDRVARRDTRDRIRFVPFQEIDPSSYGIDRRALESAMHLVGPRGEIRKGAAAAREMARLLPGWRWAWYALGIPGALPIAQRAYDWIARRRHRLGCGSASCPWGRSERMSIKLDRPEWGLTVLRIVLGIVFFVHGWPKLVGGGVTMVQGMLASVGWPVPVLFAWIVTLLEFFGGLALIAGAFTRPVAALFAVEMVIAALLFHAGKGFLVFRPEGQWGYEFNLTLAAASLCLALAGAGTLAVDEVLARRKRAAAPMM